MPQVNAEQCEARVISKRTEPRVNNVNPNICYHWRANHDCTALIDSAHSMRYCTKYAAKSSKHSEMYLQLLEHLRARGLENLTQNVRHVLVQVIKKRYPPFYKFSYKIDYNSNSNHMVKIFKCIFPINCVLFFLLIPYKYMLQVFLASCSHRTFISKFEVAYHVLQLPIISKSYPQVEVEGCYWRATLFESAYEKDTMVYSDRTKYAAYAERRDKGNKLRGISQAELDAMCLRDFCETVSSQYVRKQGETNTALTKAKKGQLKACQKGSGHWLLTKRRRRAQVRFSTILNTDLAANYVPTDRDTEVSYKTFYEMPLDRRRQLARSYYELVAYVPWHDHPDKHFLGEEVCHFLQENDPEVGFRYSLMRCERYAEIYRRMWDKGQVAPAGSLWHKDLQTAYTMHLIQVFIL